MKLKETFLISNEKNLISYSRGKMNYLLIPSIGNITKSLSLKDVNRGYTNKTKQKINHRLCHQISKAYFSGFGDLCGICQLFKICN